MTSSVAGGAVGRTVVAVLAFALLLVGGVFLPAAMLTQGEPLNWWVWFASGVLFIGAYAALTMLSTSDAPWRGARAIAVAALLVVAYLLSNLPWPPTGRTAQSTAVLIALSVLIAVGVLARDRFPRAAIGSAVVLASCSLWGEIRVGWSLHVNPIASSTSPAVAFSLILVHLVFSAGLVMLIAVRPRLGTSS